MHLDVISIHAPVKGATGGKPLLVDLFRISINAPVKGATSTRPTTPISHRISIHAPVKGATRHSQADSDPVSYFNPRSREGSDVDIKIRRLSKADISIHAPMKGATWSVT